jgi:hypothetical protein
MMAMSKLLIDEPPLQVLPTLAAQFGLERSIVLQQLHYMLKMDFRQVVERDGRRWVRATYAEWCARYFRWMKPDGLRKLFARMAEDGLIELDRLDLKKGDATGHVTLNYAALQPREDAPHPDFVAGWHPATKSEDHPATKSASTSSTKKLVQKGPAAGDPPIDHPAIQAHLNEFNLPLTAHQRELIIKGVTHVDLWQSDLAYWHGRGWTAGNIPGQLDFHANRQREQGRPGAPSAPSAPPTDLTALTGGRRIVGWRETPDGMVPVMEGDE